MAQKNKTERPNKLQFIVSDDARPAITLKPGMKLDVVSVSFITPDFKRTKPGAARLCGGSGACLALIDLGSPKE